MQHQRFKELIEKYLDESAQLPERQELTAMLEDPANLDLLDNLIIEQLASRSYKFDLTPTLRDSINQYILQKTSATTANTLPVHRVHFLRRGWFRYAAAVILLVGGAAVWYVNQSKQSTPVGGGLTSHQNIQPGTNRAVLTVGNKTIDLANNKTGIAVGDAITYTDGEKITDIGQMVMLSTPRGGQYKVALPDGSTVWLNAESSIKFPSKFVGNKRAIEISGEAYVKVAKNSKQPFYVTTRKTTIQVLGTSFNIKAYADDQTEQTTLIEGSVKILPVNTTDIAVSSDRQLNTSGTDGFILKPGQQSITSSANMQPKLISDVNLKEVTAWIDGQFVFAGRPIDDIMKDISRWYDVDIIYEGEKPVVNMRGTISKQQNINQILNLLELTETVYFKVEGRKVIVKAGSAE